MRRILLSVMILLLTPALLAETEEIRDGIDELLGTIDLSSWDSWFLENGAGAGELPSDYLRRITAMQADTKTKLPVETIQKHLFSSLRDAALKIFLLLGTAVFGASFRGLSDLTSVGETAQAAFRIVVSGAVLLMSFLEVRTAVKTISIVDRTAELLLPPLTAFLMLCGMENTAALLPVTRTFLTDAVMKVINAAVVPLAILGGVFLVLDFAGSGKLASVGKLLHRAARCLLGSVCSLYVMITALRSVAAGSADGLLIKTTKFAAGSFPSIGSLLSESVDVAFQCMRFVKNALGLTGCAVMLFVAAKPVLSIASTRIALRVSTLLSEPLAGKPYSDLLRGMSETVGILMLSELAVIASVLLMIAPVFGIGRFL